MCRQLGPATPTATTPSPCRSFDLAAIGDWFVVHTGRLGGPGESPPPGKQRLADGRLKD